MCNLTNITFIILITFCYDIHCMMYQLLYYTLIIYQVIMRTSHIKEKALGALLSLYYLQTSY